jgi:putative transposase
LFQNRYKSIVCQEETYLRELVRYIHLNPVRAGIAKSLDELKGYTFCGHSALMGKVKRGWQDTGYVLGCFGKKQAEARKKYESFVKAGIAQGRREELTGGGLIRSLGGWTPARDALKGGVHIMSDERILGDSEFVDSVISQSGERYERRHLLKQQGYDLDRVAQRVSEVLGIKPEEVFSKGRQGWKVTERSSFWFLSGKGIGYISYGTCQKAGDEFSRCWLFCGKGRVRRKKRTLFT